MTHQHVGRYTISHRISNAAGSPPIAAQVRFGLVHSLMCLGPLRPTITTTTTDGLIPYFTIYYCSLSYVATALRGFIQFLLMLLLVLLFRVLGSTAVGMVVDTYHS